tara:strand:- start:5514 stop:7796 length:2283 start_codon:yes stop_codon:yes gene_type:complete
VKTGSEIFSLLNLETDGIRPVKVAVEANRLEEAEIAYLNYYRQRQAPFLPWNAPGELDLKKRTVDFDFLLYSLPSFTWKDREKVRKTIYLGRGYVAARSAPPRLSPYTAKDLANLILQHKIFLPVHSDDGIVDLGANWDWEVVPPVEGHRWPMSLCYQYFLKVLAVTYWNTGEEKYIKKLVWICLHYIEYVRGRSDWMWLPDMQLARTYLQILPFILSWKNLPPSDLCILLHWLATTCAGSMGKVKSAPGNQLLYNGIGLLWLGVGMHEFRSSSDWRDQGLEQCSRYFATDGAYYPDGSSRENSLGYTVRASYSGLEALMLLKKNGWASPKPIMKAMRKRAYFLADMRRPDGLCPSTGDGQQASPDNYIEAILELGDDPSLEHVIREGKQGPHPDHTSIYYPWMGTAVMRSSWDRNANYMMCDMGPLGDIHAHEAKLSIEVAVLGRTLIADKGVHTYSRESRHHRWYRFFGSTRGHSTVTVDGLSQMRLVGGQKSVSKPLNNRWYSSKSCDFISGDYDEGWGPSQFTEPMRSVYPPPPFEGEIKVWVTHSRTVLFVKSTGLKDSCYWVVSDRLLGSEEHTYEQLFHFIPVKTSFDSKLKIIRTISPNQPNLALIPIPNPQLEVDVVEGKDDGGEGLQGWHIIGGRQIPAPCAIYRKRSKGPVLIQTVLWPIASEEKLLPTVESIGPADDGWIRISFQDGERQDLICLSPGLGYYELSDLGTGTVAFEGEGMLLRLDNNKSPRDWDVIGGGKALFNGETLR